MEPGPQFQNPVDHRGVTRNMPSNFHSSSGQPTSHPTKHTPKSSYSMMSGVAAILHKKGK